MDPHDKMRSRDVNKVARGEQAPRPAHEYGSIRSAPPKPTPTLPLCIKDKGDGTPQCVRFEKNYKILCPLEWILQFLDELQIERWDEDQKRGVLVIE
ncbi:putative cytochrome c oxidase subunit 6b-like [Rosa chinensis]|uniref:putative cytochrome c oxidase subunit 6b-like n=1 Tax=Rosa chinensis TaxID=74649 RepID=UPI000D089D08|nr:putative cytochrome c oxidase subunit 6b-like [Rosa chinensis]